MMCLLWLVHDGVYDSGLCACWRAHQSLLEIASDRRFNLEVALSQRKERIIEPAFYVLGTLQQRLRVVILKSIL
jgi:hypothetical protein